MGKTPRGRTDTGRHHPWSPGVLPHTKSSLPNDFALYSTGWNHFYFPQLIFEVILVGCFLQLKRLCVLGRPGQFVCNGLIFIESSRLCVLLLTGSQTVRAACLQRHPLPVRPFLFAGGLITVYWTEELKLIWLKCVFCFCYFMFLCFGTRQFWLYVFFLPSHLVLLVRNSAAWPTAEMCFGVACPWTWPFPEAFEAMKMDILLYYASDIEQSREFCFCQNKVGMNVVLSEI